MNKRIIDDNNGENVKIINWRRLRKKTDCDVYYGITAKKRANAYIENSYKY